MAEQRITIYGEEKLPDRSTLRFPFRAEEVRDGARAKLDYHRERLAWWQAEKATAETALQDSLELRDQEVTGGTRKVAVFDEERQSRLSECTQKVERHRSAVEDFSAWVVGLEALAGQSVRLSLDDVRHFGLAERSE